MKSIVLLLSFMTVSNVFSIEKNVGDRSTYSVNFLGAQATMQTIVTKLNRSSDEYDIKKITTMAGQEEVTIERVPSEDLMTKEMANTLLANCTFMGGIIETIHLAGAPRTTCKVEADSDSILPILNKAGFSLSNNSSGHIWIGAFPINGLGKLVTDDIEMEITSMNW